ncbi:30S ribosomal protein S1 [Luteolibacter yonseiensis]
MIASQDYSRYKLLRFRPGKGGWTKATSLPRTLVTVDHAVATIITHESMWTTVEKLYVSGQGVRGWIRRSEPGGYRVDIGCAAYLPSDPLVEHSMIPELRGSGKPQIFYILHLDEMHRKITVSLNPVGDKEKKGYQARLNRLEERIVKLEKYGANDEVVRAKVVAETQKGYLLDIGFPAFMAHEAFPIMVGEEIEVMLTGFDEQRSLIFASRGKVEKLKELSRKKETIESFRVGQVVSGRVINITGPGAFLDVCGVGCLLRLEDMSWLLGQTASELINENQLLTVVILSLDREKGQVSVGLKQMSDDPWMDIVSKYPIGHNVKGRVTKLLPYGAFIEIERVVEGFVHVSELSWVKRITRPSDVLKIGQEISAVVLGINIEERKISLSVRQLDPNPWDDLELRYPVGAIIKGSVRNLTGYGAFVELEEGIDGMIHVSNMSWTRKIDHPSEVFKKNDEVEAIVLAIDKANQRVALGIKQTEYDPWSLIDSHFKVGDLVKGTVVKIASCGAFVSLDGDIDGLIDNPQLSEDHVEKVKDIIKVGEEIEARVIKVDHDERRVALSLRKDGGSGDIR